MDRPLATSGRDANGVLWTEHWEYDFEHGYFFDRSRAWGDVMWSKPDDKDGWRDRDFEYGQWPASAPDITSELALYGFYHSPRADFPDRVKCAECGLTLYDWERGDEPGREHFQGSPKCSFGRKWRQLERRRKSQERSSGELEDVQDGWQTAAGTIRTFMTPRLGEDSHSSLVQSSAFDVLGQNEEDVAAKLREREVELALRREQKVAAQQAAKLELHRVRIAFSAQRARAAADAARARYDSFYGRHDAETLAKFESADDRSKMEERDRGEASCSSSANPHAWKRENAMRGEAQELMPLEWWACVYVFLRPQDIAKLNMVCRAFRELGKQFLPKLDMGSLWHAAPLRRPFSRFVFERAVREVILTALSRKTPFVETIELQSAIIYDRLRDRRISQRILLPHKVRARRGNFCCLGSDMLPAAQELGLDCLTDDQMNIRTLGRKVGKVLAKKYDAFFTSIRTARTIPRRMGPCLNRLGKFPMDPCPESGIVSTEWLRERVEREECTVRFRLMRAKDANYPVGHAELSPQQLAENLS